MIGNNPNWQTRGYYEPAFSDVGCNCGDCPCCVCANQYMSCDHGYCGTCQRGLDECKCPEADIEYGCEGCE